MSREPGEEPPLPEPAPPLYEVPFGILDAVEDPAEVLKDLDHRRSVALGEQLIEAAENADRLK